MSIQAVGWVLDQEGIPARHKLVLVAIANHANHIDGYCWLNAGTIALEAACSERGVFNFVGDLVRNGFIRKAQRRGDDGKQRANDYWILFNRPEAAWIARGEVGLDVPADDEEEIAEELEVAADDTQDVVPQDARRAGGDEAEKPPSDPGGMHAGAAGPHAPVCSHIDSAQPSKTNPEKAGLKKAAPVRRYAPPPVQPQAMGATTAGGDGDFIFVFYPSKAYSAWAAVKEAERKANRDYRPFRNLTMRNGKEGWYFPSLFPPAAAKSESEGDAGDIDPQFSKAG